VAPRTRQTGTAAAPSPTAASTTSRIPNIARNPNWKPPIIRPTRPYRTSSNCWPLPDVTSSSVGVFLFTIFDPRI
jgi:hypothetical protein